MKPEDIEVWLAQTGPECDESSGVTNVFGARPLDTSTPPRRSKRKALPDHSPSSATPSSAPKKARTSRAVAPTTKLEAKDTPTTTANTHDHNKIERDWGRLPWLEAPSVTTTEQDALDEQNKRYMDMFGAWAEDPGALDLDAVAAKFERDRNRVMAAHRKTRRTVR